MPNEFVQIDSEVLDKLSPILEDRDISRSEFIEEVLSRIIERQNNDDHIRHWAIEEYKHLLNEMDRVLDDIDELGVMEANEVLENAQRADSDNRSWIEDIED